MIKCTNPEFYQKIAEIEAFDSHSHIDTAHPIARGIHDILLYHMVITDLYSAGCPSGARLSEEPDEDEIESRVKEAITYLPKIYNTSGYYLLTIILENLFDWYEPITLNNWHELDARIKAYGKQEGRLEKIMDKAHIVKSNTELWRGHEGKLDHLFTYSLEWAFFTRAQWGRFDTALIELEYAYNHDEPCPPLPVTLTPEMICFKKKINTIEDVEVALNHYLDKTPVSRICAIASHFSTEFHYREVTAEEMKNALKNRSHATIKDEEVYANYIFNRYLSLFEERKCTTLLQFSTGAEPLPFETGSKMPSETIFELAKMFVSHPKIRFNLHVSNMAKNQELCTLSREMPNVSLSGYWWHNFFPCYIKRILSERLDMLPVSKFIGFFSDAYCMEWAYAKQAYIRTFTADVLWEKIQMGQYDEKTAIDIAYQLFFGTAADLFGIKH